MRLFVRALIRALRLSRAVCAPRPACGASGAVQLSRHRVQDGGIEGTLVIHVIDAAHELGITPLERLMDNAVAERQPAEDRRSADAAADAAHRPAADLEWTSLEVLREDMALRFKYRIQAEPAGSMTIDTNLFPYDPLHQTFINIYEDGSLRQQLIFNAGTNEYVYYAGTTQGTMAVMQHVHPVGHPPHHDRARPHPVPGRAAAARRHAG